MNQYFLEPLSDPIAGVFAAIIGLLFIVGLFRSLVSAEGLTPFSRYAPTALTTIGVVGTFTGIYVGLVEFDVADIDSSIPPLLAGLKIAFSTSILGMVTSILLKFAQGTRRPKAENDSVTAGDIFKVMTEVRDETKKNRERSEELLLEVKGAISGDGESSLVTQIQKLRTSTQDGHLEVTKTTAEGFSTMNEEFRSFAEKMAENNSKALIDALQEVISNFNTQLNEQFGDNFKQLNEAVGALLTWQENYKAQVEAMVAEFAEVSKGIVQTRDAIGVISEKSADIPKTMAELSRVIKVADDQIELLNGHLEAVAELGDKAATAFPIIEDNIDKLTSDFSSSVRENANLLGLVMAEQSKAMQEASRHSVSMLEDSTARHHEAVAKLEAGMTEIPKQVNGLMVQLQTDMSDAFEAFTKEMKAGLQGQSAAITEAVGDLRGSLQKSLTDTNDMIQQSFHVFDQQMQEEILRTIETMGGHLASLSHKFVEDYTPLTDKLRRVVEMSRAV